MSRHQDAPSFKRAFNPYPRGGFKSLVIWDKKAIAEFYGIGFTDECHKRERTFVHFMVDMLNRPEVDDFLFTQMKVKVVFDRLQGAETNLVCRFDLPCSSIKERACMIYLYDIVMQNPLRHFIEKVVFRGPCFVVYSPLG